MIIHTAETGLRKIPATLRPHLFSQGLMEINGKCCQGDLAWKTTQIVDAKIKLHTAHLGQDAVECCLLLG
jgi:hypothetical protein